MFTVYENGKPAQMAPDSFSCWQNATFPTKRQAEVYAHLWCYPVVLEVAKVQAQEMEIGKEYNYSMCEFPLMMKIVEEV